MVIDQTRHRPTIIADLIEERHLGARERFTKIIHGTQELVARDIVPLDDGEA